MPRLKIRSQLPLIEKGGVLDDCGPSSVAAACSWITGKEISARDGVLAKEAATGKKDIPGVADNGTTMAEIIKIAKVFDVSGKWAKSWDEVVSKAKSGSAIVINVQAAKNYPKQAISSWHKRFVGRHAGATYGHMTCAVYDKELGWQYADPTFSGRGQEAYAALVSESELKAMASSKGDAPHKRCIILSK